jgi:hypothetical protein
MSNNKKLLFIEDDALEPDRLVQNAAASRDDVETQHRTSQ